MSETNINAAVKSSSKEKRKVIVCLFFLLFLGLGFLTMFFSSPSKKGEEVRYFPYPALFLKKEQNKNHSFSSFHLKAYFLEIEKQTNSAIAFLHHLGKPETDSETKLEMKQKRKPVTKSEGKSARKAVREKDQFSAPLRSIILDIDETAISTFQYMKQKGINRDERGIKEAIERSSYPIKPVRRLYREAMKRNVKVFFVTNREERIRTQTESNLKRAGYPEWEELIMRPTDFRGTAETFKQQARKGIRDQGYRIVLNIGDQESDLKELNGEGDRTKQIKLPNPFYTVE